MKFAHKLFFSVIALLTVIFLLFGTFMLSSYFDRMLERETEQGNGKIFCFRPYMIWCIRTWKIRSGICWDTGRKFRNRTDDRSERYGMYDP